MTLDLSNQTVLVTGASRGIGRAISLALAELGATVAVHYGTRRNAAQDVVDACGNGAQLFQADLASLNATDALFPAVVETLGPVQGLVLNAGIARPTSLDTDLETWHDAWTQTIHVNLRAAELLCRHALPHFQSHPPQGGRLVSIASRAAFRGDAPEYMSYAASKAGLVALTRSIARGFGEDEIKAFTVAPGFTQTDMAQNFADAYGKDHLTDDLALETLTEPADIAPLIAFLLTGHADHATGTTIDVNAGSYVH